MHGYCIYWNRPRSAMSLASGGGRLVFASTCHFTLPPSTQFTPDERVVLTDVNASCASEKVISRKTHWFCPESWRTNPLTNGVYTGSLWQIIILIHVAALYKRVNTQRTCGLQQFPQGKYEHHPA